MWTVNVVRGEPGKQANVTAHKFDTKREAHAFLKRISYSFIGRIGQTYTIYPRGR